LRTGLSGDAVISRAVLFEQFVGRDGELDRLLALREQSALEGRVGLVTIRGDGGIGKSRLIAEFGRRNGGFRKALVHVRAEAEGAASYAPIVDALEEIVRANPRNELALSALQTLRSPDGDDVSPEEIVRRRVVGIADAFVAEARRRGHLSLALDDAHVSDTETLSALRFLARRNNAPLLIIAAYRPEDQGDHFRLAALAALEREGADRIVLGPLQQQEQLQLLKAALPAAPDTVLGRIAELAEGQPFVAEELARSASDGQSSADVPLTLRAAILGRVADLSREARDVLQRAAILGPRFSFEDLVALCGSDVEVILATLRDARKRQILIEEERNGRIRFGFRHALTQHVFIGEMLAEERRELHRVVARLIESSGTNDRIEELAYHRWAAGDAEPAIVACEAAGDTAMRFAAFNDAARWFERALEFADADGDVARLSEKRLNALMDGAAIDALTAHCDRTSARLEGTSFEETAARGACAAALLLARMQRAREAAALLDSSVVVRCALRDAEIRFERKLGLVWVAMRRGQGDADTFAALDAAAIDARELGLHAKARLMHARQSAVYFHEDPAEFFPVSDEAAALAKACGDYRLQARVASNHALFDHAFSLDRAIAMVRESVAHCESRGDHAAAWPALTTLAGYLICAGKLVEASQLMRQAEARGSLNDAWLGSELMLTRLVGGDMQRFVALLDPERFEGSVWVAYVVVAQASCALSPDAAKALINRAMPFVKGPAGDFAVSVALFGDDAALATVRDAMRDYVPLSPLGLANFKLFSAVSSRREHRYLAARDQAREAIVAYRECGHLTNGLAEAYVEAGEPQEAIDLLERIGATAALARLRGASRSENPASAVTLSQRETQVAHLAARGISSRDTGSRLGISARTVETHLKNVYRKLGVSGRPELAAELERRRLA